LHGKVEEKIEKMSGISWFYIYVNNCEKSEGKTGIV
jgi:hypothetical protein